MHLVYDIYLDKNKAYDYAIPYQRLYSIYIVLGHERPL